MDSSDSGESGAMSRTETQNSKRTRVAEIGSVAALTISLFALGINVYQTRLMQAQARASVWPYLAIGFHYFDRGDNAGFAWQIDNNGVGPALIKSVTLTLDDRPVRRWDTVFDVVLGKGASPTAILSAINGKVLPPSTNRETTLTALSIPDADAAKAFYDSRNRFKMSICYCSVYDDCWVAKWLDRSPVPVSRCDSVNTVQFDM